MRLLPIAVLVATLLFGCGAKERASETVDQLSAAAEERVRAELNAREERQLISSFDHLRSSLTSTNSIVLYEVSNEFDSDYSALKGKPSIAGYPIRRQRQITSKDAGPLVATLTTRRAYFPPGDGWTCIFEPHHVLEIKGATKRVSAVICLKCGDVQFLVDGNVVVLKGVRPEAQGELTQGVNALLPVAVPAA